MITILGPDNGDRASQNDETTTVPKPVQGVQLCTSPIQGASSSNRTHPMKRKYVQEIDSSFPRKHRS